MFVCSCTESFWTPIYHLDKRERCSNNGSSLYALCPMRRCRTVEATTRKAPRVGLELASDMTTDHKVWYASEGATHVMYFTLKMHPSLFIKMQWDALTCNILVNSMDVIKNNNIQVAFPCHSIFVWVHFHAIRYSGWEDGKLKTNDLSIYDFTTEKIQLL